MEMEYSKLVVIGSSVASFVVFFVMFVKSVRIWKVGKSYSHIPGPRKLPLIGNLHLLLSTSNPHHLFRDLAKKYGGLMHLQLGEVPFLVVSTMEMVEEVVKTNDIIFSNRPPGIAPEVLTYNYTDIGYAPYGEYWRQLRKICTVELLSAKRVLTFRSVRIEENLKVAKAVAADEGVPTNMSEKVFMLAYDITTISSLGNPTKEKGTLMPLIRECTQISSGLMIADLYPSVKILPYITGVQSKVDIIYKKVRSAFDGIIEEHREAILNADPAGDTLEDLADVLLKFQQDGDQLPLTDGNITAVLMDMFIGGSETSAGAVEWAMSELIKNPSAMKKAQEEVRKVFDDEKGYIDEDKFGALEYIKLVIKETLRLHPPLPFLVPRFSSKECEINGYRIPAQTRVLINVWALSRDPKHWNDAEKFMPERFLEKPMDFKGNTYEYMPFGSGRRICPGMNFGLASVEFTLATLLYHFDWEMPRGIHYNDLDMTDEFGATVARKNHLFLIPTVKRPLPY